MVGGRVLVGGGTGFVGGAVVKALSLEALEVGGLRWWQLRQEQLL